MSDGPAGGVPRHLVAELARHGAGLLRGAWPQERTAPVPSRARWSTERARQWHEQVGWLVGCNFVPSTASNQLEMFQADTFDPVTIDRELGWAEGLGFNSVRVFLHHLLVGAPGFLDRVHTFLDIADGHGIGTMLVLFDGCWNPEASLGPQRPPRPGVHNSRWVQSPGAAVLRDPSRWSSLRPYVDSVMTRFGGDARVHAWDLFNEPDGPELYHPRTGTPHKGRAVTALLGQVFDWATEIDPDQPLTAGVFVGTSGSVERVGELNRLMLSRSDVISFHSYQARPRLERTIGHLQRYGRPVLCTEWLGRPVSGAELIEVLHDHDVGAYSWGLVDGRTQTRYPWSSWWRTTPEDRVWFHDLFHADGTPYDEAEARTFRRVCGLEGRPEPGDGPAY